MSTFYDTHCHVELLDPTILDKCQGLGIKIVSVSTDIKSFNRASRLIDRGLNVHKQFIGYHPENANPRTFKYAYKVLKFASENPVDGIGEVGLDFSGNLKDYRETQIDVFIRFLSIAERKNLPVSIHSRQAHQEVLDVLKQYKVRAALHWFSGGKKQFQQAIDDGHYLGFTPSVLKSERYEALIKMTPSNQILSESDAPVYGMTPLMIPQVIGKMAQIKGLSEEEMGTIISDNCKSFFG